MKMRISFLLILCILFTSVGTFTQAAPLDTLKKAAKLREIRQLTTQVRMNAAKTAQMKLKAREKYTRAKAVVKGLVRDKDSITMEQIEAVKEALAQVKQDRQQVAQTVKESEAAMAKLKEARKANDFESSKECLESILKTQEDGLKQLESVIANMDKIIKMKAS